ncbi:MAG: hypothetical protein R6U84_10710, partial [Candidatus Cloacimonadales bacterium]
IVITVFILIDKFIRFGTKELLTVESIMQFVFITLGIIFHLFLDIWLDIHINGLTAHSKISFAGKTIIETSNLHKWCDFSSNISFAPRWFSLFGGSLLFKLKNGSIIIIDSYHDYQEVLEYMEKKTSVRLNQNAKYILKKYKKKQLKKKSN